MGTLPKTSAGRRNRGVPPSTAQRILDEMVQQGLVVLSDVDVIKYAHDYGKTERRQETRA